MSQSALFPGQSESRQLDVEPGLPCPGLPQLPGGEGECDQRVQEVPGEKASQVCEADQGEEREARHHRPSGPDRQGGWVAGWQDSE